MKEINRYKFKLSREEIDHLIDISMIRDKKITAGIREFYFSTENAAIIQTKHQIKPSALYVAIKRFNMMIDKYVGFAQLLVKRYKSDPILREELFEKPPPYQEPEPVKFRRGKINIPKLGS